MYYIRIYSTYSIIIYNMQRYIYTSQKKKHNLFTILVDMYVTVRKRVKGHLFFHYYAFRTLTVVGYSMFTVTYSSHHPAGMK